MIAASFFCMVLLTNHCAISLPFLLRYSRTFSSTISGLRKPPSSPAIGPSAAAKLLTALLIPLAIRSCAVGSSINPTIRCIRCGASFSSRSRSISVKSSDSRSFILQSRATRSSTLFFTCSLTHSSNPGLLTNAVAVDSRNPTRWSRFSEEMIAFSSCDRKPSIWDETMRVTFSTKSLLLI